MRYRSIVGCSLQTPVVQMLLRIYLQLLDKDIQVYIIAGAHEGRRPEGTTHSSSRTMCSAE